jgi:hypothetical protein
LLAGLEPESAAVMLAGAGGSVRAALSAARDGDRDER